MVKMSPSTKKRSPRLSISAVNVGVFVEKCQEELGKCLMKENTSLNQNQRRRDNKMSVGPGTAPGTCSAAARRCAGPSR